MSYAEVFEVFPSELRLPMARLVDVLRAEFEVPRADFADLKAAMQSLAEAQARTEARLDRLAVVVETLAQAQARTQEEVTLFRRTFMSQIGGLGSRWGLQTEEAFRHGIRTILGEVGFTAERFLTWDAAGEVFGHPEQVELDIVIQNGKALWWKLNPPWTERISFQPQSGILYPPYRPTGRQEGRDRLLCR